MVSQSTNGVALRSSADIGDAGPGVDAHDCTIGTVGSISNRLFLWETACEEGEVLERLL